MYPSTRASGDPTQATTNAGNPTFARILNSVARSARLHLMKNSPSLEVSFNDESTLQLPIGELVMIMPNKIEKIAYDNPFMEHQRLRPNQRERRAIMPIRKNPLTYCMPGLFSSLPMQRKAMRYSPEKYTSRRMDPTSEYTSQASKGFDSHRMGPGTTLDARTDPFSYGTTKTRIMASRNEAKPIQRDHQSAVLFIFFICSLQQLFLVRLASSSSLLTTFKLSTLVISVDDPNSVPFSMSITSNLSDLVSLACCMAVCIVSVMVLCFSHCIFCMSWMSIFYLFVECIIQ